MSIKQVTVEDLWPGDVITERGERKQIHSIEVQPFYKTAVITFVTPSGRGMYTEYHSWEEPVLRVG